jgi:hypothetical protein
MLVNKYYIESKKHDLSVVVGYNEGGILCHFEASELTPASVAKFLNHLPFTEEELDAFKKKFLNISVTVAQTDLSFKAFYDAYDYKVGKKAKAEKIWEKLNDTQRLACYRVLPKYNRHLEFTKISKAYLETFLNNAYFENEYK